MGEYKAVLINPETNMIRESLITIEAENILKASQIFFDLYDHSTIEILQIMRVI